MTKSVHAQFKTMLKNAMDDDEDARCIVVYMSVRFYVTDPCKLVSSSRASLVCLALPTKLISFASQKHELTRYLFYLQLRKDILQGRLAAIPFDFAVDLFSYFLQAELGDHAARRDLPGYASQFDFVLNQSAELERAAELKHAKLKYDSNSFLISASNPLRKT